MYGSLPSQEGRVENQQDLIKFVQLVNLSDVLRCSTKTQWDSRRSNINAHVIHENETIEHFKLKNVFLNNRHAAFTHIAIMGEGSLESGNGSP